MDKKGNKEHNVFEKLKEFQKKDLTHRSGRILGSMCTCPHEVGRKAYSMFLESNLGDPGLFKGTKMMEDEVIATLGTLLGCRDVFGHIITGGTEANIMAMRAARNSSKIKNPEIIVPKSAHFSFRKAADILRLELKEAELDENYCVDINSVKKLISADTIAIVGVAGTTELGKIDPIHKLSDLCLDNDLYLHVDAAFGGFVIPFLNEIGYKLPEFDFKLDGVCSITVDPHKMGLAPIPTGGILFREKRYLDNMSIETPYLTEKKQSTIVGTRTGAAAAATWALMKHLGRDGYIKIAKRCMELTELLFKGITDAGFEIITEPTLNILAFRSNEMSVEDIYSFFEERGWAVSISSYPKAIRIVVMPHIKLEHLLEFLKDLKSIKKVDKS
ncbi:MAG: tyrosine decarboxylase MfnA [Euryarchaeota archaeon]|nr:tyrosine decarboxylase MfnA [Euryarchaeota archaeon]